MLLKCLLLLVVLFVHGNTIAQHFIEGKVFELNTRIPLQEVKIENHRTKKFTFTDSAGRFRIAAEKEDLLTANAFSYLPYTLLLVDLKFREIFLQPEINLLDEVRVKSTEMNLGSLLFIRLMRVAARKAVLLSACGIGIKTVRKNAGRSEGLKTKRS